jgi:hypothetical protein
MLVWGLVIPPFCALLIIAVITGFGLKSALVGLNKGLWGLWLV